MRCLNRGCENEAVDFLEAMTAYADGEKTKYFQPKPSYCSYRCWELDEEMSFVKSWAEAA